MTSSARCGRPSNASLVTLSNFTIQLLNGLASASALFLVAAGLTLIFRDVALALWGAEDLLGPRAPGLAGTVEILGRAVPQYDLFLVAVGPLVLALLTWLITRTRFGVMIRAASENRVLTAALGIDQSKLYTAVFALGALLAGWAGALQLPREPANLGMDLAIIADAVVVTVVGGLRSIPGAFLVALVIGLTKALFIALGTVMVGDVTFPFSKLTLV